MYRRSFDSADRGAVRRKVPTSLFLAFSNVFFPWLAPAASALRLSFSREDASGQGRLGAGPAKPDGWRRAARVLPLLPVDFLWIRWLLRVVEQRG